jgi:16S rRNA (uracil1498-N3)-methyltransferase
MDDLYKLPRIYIDTGLAKGQDIILPEATHHYLRNVMRLEPGAQIRAFNGWDGEYLGRLVILDKRRAILTLEKQLRLQPAPARKIHLLFAPIKKERMDWLVEKAVELGATDLHPVLTQNTDIRKINEERMAAQIIEAAEQCERLDLPKLHPSQELSKKMAGWNVPLLAAIERFGAKTLSSIKTDADISLLIGPSGGFTAEEKDRIAAQPFVTPVSLGENVLRSETAAAAALAIVSL